MRISDVLSTPDGDRLIDQISAATGLSRDDAGKAVRAIVPELVFGLERNTLSRGGLADLLAAIASGRHEGYLDSGDVFRDPAIAADGNRILGHILGSESRADRVAQRLSADTGLPAGILRTILPGLAALVLGWLFRNGKGALGDVLTRLPRGGDGRYTLPTDGGFSFPSPSGGSGRGAEGGGMGFPSGKDDRFELPDLDGQGRRGSPPYGELSDILKNGGRGSGMLARIIREVIGGLLGFRSSGIMGWIIRLIVMRWGWSIVKLVLRSVLGFGR
jgi:hypothetical protein